MPRLRKRRFSIREILRWADAYRARTGQWPTAASGAVPGVRGEKWLNVNVALQYGLRGLPGGASLARLLAQHRGARNSRALPPLTEKQILAWADAHFRRTGTWPLARSGPIREAPGETWSGVYAAVYQGIRGLRRRTTLPQLLARQRGMTRHPRLTIPQILAWADAYHARTSRWPTERSGPIAEASGETWRAVAHALQRGNRGLAGGDSLPRLLFRKRNVRHCFMAPRLTRKQILAWADAHRRRTGRWPTRSAGPIVEAPNDSWKKIDYALSRGLRGLAPGSSLPRLLARHRGRRHIRYLPSLTLKKILRWADLHFGRTGQWPDTTAGPVVDAPGEHWKTIAFTLLQGGRGLPRGLPLHRLLFKYGRLPKEMSRRR